MIGVYVLYDHAGDPLYAGASRDVPRRVREQRRCDWGAAIATVATEASATWADALRLEHNLIADLNPRHNHQSLDPIEQARTTEEFARLFDADVIDVLAARHVSERESA